MNYYPNNPMHGFKRKLHNIQFVFHDKKYYIITIMSSVLIASVMLYFTHYDLLVGNFGRLYANTQVTSEILLAGLFGLNIALLWYKLKLSSSIKKEASETGFASIIGIIVSGCPSCGITIASYVGLASLFAALPLKGLELKFAGIGILLFSVNSLSKNLHTCKIKK